MIFIKKIVSYKAIGLSVVAHFNIFLSIGYSQVSTQTLRGTIRDSDTQKPIEAAHVVILNTEPLLETISNQNGEYRIENVLVGRYDIKISFTGYEDKIVSNSLIKSGKESILIIELQTSIVNLKTVEITNKPTVNNEMATVSSRSFSVDETKRYPASINDPARMVMSYAGITSGNDRDNEIVIRGNSPKGLLWMLEGGEIPSPNHFSQVGSSNGSVSMLSSTMLANSDFITGAFPAEYGNASSGVFDIKLRNGNNEKREYSLQAGFLGIDVGAEGPFKKGKAASYLFNYRYSSISIFNLFGYKVEGDAVPRFQDLSFKLFFPTKKAGVFSLYGIGGLSTISQKIDDKKESYDYNLGVVGLSHQYRINDKNYIKSIVSFSNKASLFDKSTQKTFYNYDNYYHFSFIDRSLGISINMTSKINAKNTLKTGINYTAQQYNYYEENYSYYYSIRSIYTDEQGNTNQSQAYCSWKYRINKSFSLVNGIHFLQLDLNKHYSVEPRSSVKWEINTSQSLSLAFGIHSKIEPFQIYVDKTKVGNDRVRLNQNLDFSKSRHYILSYDKILTENLFFKIEAYYQQLYNIPISEDTASTFSTLNYGSDYAQGKLVNKGTGRNYGIEITIDKKFYKNYFFLITASLFESKYIAADKIERNTAYNRNYVSNYIIGKEFWIGDKRRNLISTSIRVNWTGGRRYTPIDLEKSQLYNREILKTNEVFSKKMDDYFRIDIQIGYIHNHSKYNSELRLDIQNVTNRKNIYEMYYEPTKKEIEQAYQLGLIPVLSYRIEF